MADLEDGTRIFYLEPPRGVKCTQPCRLADGKFKHIVFTYEDTGDTVGGEWEIPRCNAPRSPMLDGQQHRGITPAENLRVCIYAC